MSKTIPLVDLFPQYRQMGREMRTKATEIFRSGRYVGGSEVTQFTQEWADFVGAGHCVPCGNGTDALELALEALRPQIVSPHAHVAVPALTFVATAEAVVRAGHVPVFVDVGPDGLMDPEDLSRVASRKRIDVLMPVHLWGQPSAMDALMEVVPDALVIEDSAQAHAATYPGGERVGGQGRICTWSFFPGKNLGGTGDGGAMTTDDPDLAQRLRRLAQHGRLSKHDHTVIGRNSRMDAFHAAMLRIKLPYLSEWTELRRLAAAYYRQAMEDRGLVERGWSLVVSEEMADLTSWHIFPVLVEPAIRDRAVEGLKVANVGAGIHYPYSIPDLPAYRPWKRSTGYPMAEFLAASEISLPLFPEITQQQQDAVVDAMDITMASLRRRRKSKKNRRGRK